MNTTDVQEALLDYVRAIASAAPDGWDRIVVYVEYQRDPNGFLANESMQKYFVGAFESTDFPATFESMTSRLRFYEVCAAGSDGAWSGMRLEVLRAGRYQAKYYYDSTPLMDGDYETAEARLKG